MSDKAIEAALDAAEQFVEGSQFSAGKSPLWTIHRRGALGDELSWPVVADFDSREERNRALKEMNMRAAIAAYEDALWEPMESAPKDGTKILISDDDIIIVGYWGVPGFYGPSLNGKNDWRCAWDMEIFDDPTRWRPLPQPPKDKP